MFFGKNPCIYTLQVIVIRYQYSKLKFEETTTTSIIVMARIICLQLPLQRVSGVCDLLRITILRGLSYRSLQPFIMILKSCLEFLKIWLILFSSKTSSLCYV